MKRARTVLVCCLVMAAWMPVKAAVAASTCTVSTTGVNFGVYDPVASLPNDSAGSVTISCTNAPPPGNATIGYAITLSPGGSGSAAARWMSSGGSRMHYNLYTSASHSQVWGDGGAGGERVGGALRVTGRRSLSSTHAIYGRIPARQDPAPGSYTDTIVVSLDF